MSDSRAFKVVFPFKTAPREAVLTGYTLFVNTCDNRWHIKFIRDCLQSNQVRQNGSSD